MADVQIAIIEQGDTEITLAVPGVQGPVGNAIPAGGTTNQVLFKSSATNYDATWGNVTSAMITDLAIVDADVNASAAIAYSKLATLTSGNIVLGSSANVATSTAVTGDVTIGNTGVTAIAAGVIVNADVNASAGIVDTKLATIATAGKVSNSATTATNANTASTIVARDASGNFTAGTITANLTGTASNVTTNANLSGHVTSVGNAAVLGSFTSANLATALTDETGTGANVFATSPTLVTPALGTPSSGALTNCTFPTLNQNTTGNAATVTTNANLTGDVTSVGNATAIAAGVIVNADVNASSAIAGTKIAPDFGAQNITTTGTNTAASFSPTSNTAPTNGVYLPGSNRLALSTGGVDRISINPAGAITGSDTSVFSTGRIVSGNFQTGFVNLVLHTGTAPSGISGTNLFKQIQPGFYEVVAFGLAAYQSVGPGYALIHALFSVDLLNVFTTISSNVRIQVEGSASWNTSTNFVFATFGNQAYQNYPNLFFRRLGYNDNTL